MKVFILLALVAGVFSSHEICGENQRYTSCGTTCPLTCDNYNNPPKFCNLMCYIGCECVEGYVKTADGRCILPESCPVNADEKSCEAKPDRGMCLGYFPMWYYDAEAGTCKKFIYGGCQGNGNRYRSQDECLQNCGNTEVKQSSSEVCELPADPGLWFAYIPRFYFDKTSGECRYFIYGGFGGNGNNFKTLEECQNSCGNFADTEVKQSSSEVCELSAEPGLCFAYIPRFYFDKTSGECSYFIYGGCGGNGNNFKTLEECQNSCGNFAAVEKKTCLEYPDGRICKGHFPMWYYSIVSGSCKQFIYGGCAGTGNRYETEEECMQNCRGVELERSSSDTCDLPAEIGLCKGFFPRYHFERTTGQCKEFAYGGCGGNANNFKSIDECRNTCGNRADSVSESACDQEKKVGPCMAGFRRFYFNKETGQCEMFIYGGCQGNSNNFNSKEDCDAVCVQ